MKHNPILDNAAFDEADVIFNEILDSFPFLDEDDNRRECVLLRVMTHCVTALHLYGWSEDMLIEQVEHFCELSREIFGEDEDEDEED